MNILCTVLFSHFWFELIFLMLYNKEDPFWLIIEGMIIILGGLYWSVKDFKMFLGEE